MRIVLATPAYVPAVDFGGPVSKVTTLAHGLVRRGHEVEVWCADYGPERSRVPAGVRDVNGVEVRYLRRLASYRWTPLAPGALMLGHKGRTPDIVHCFGIRDALTVPAAIAARRRGTPYVVEPLGMTVARLRHARLKRAVDVVSTSRHLRQAAAVIANSRLEACEIERRVPGITATVRPNPLSLGVPPPERRVEAWASGHLRAVTVTRLSVTKGLETLVEAVAETPGVSLRIVGPDDGDGTGGAVLRAIAERRAGDRIELLGPRYGAERDAVVVTADVFVLASRTESFGNAAAEAAALGVPVIVTDRCGVAEVISDLGAGLVVTPDAASIARALATLRDDPELRSAMGCRGPAIREVLDADRVAQLQEAIYMQVLHRA